MNFLWILISCLKPFLRRAQIGGGGGGFKMAYIFYVLAVMSFLTLCFLKAAVSFWNYSKYPFHMNYDTNKIFKFCKIAVLVT